MMSRKFRRLGPAGLAIAAALAVTPAVFAPMPAQARIAVGISVNIAPPVLPVYVQPPMPAEGYIWVPGYWAYGPDGYYWVDGAWEEPPEAGLLWTPAYWGWDDGAYVFNAGYWGPQVGFYGGIDYGYGYTGIGYAGGYWEHGHLFYNRAVNNFGGVHVTNVYNRTVVNNVNTTRVSYNGGSGGTRARPTTAELAAQREHHVAPTAHQVHQMQAARSNPAMRSTAIAAHGNVAPHAAAAAAAHPPAPAPGRFAAGHQPLNRSLPAAASHSTAASHPTAAAAHPAPSHAATPRPDQARSPSLEHRPAMAAGRYTAPARPMPTHTTPVAAPHQRAPAPHPVAPAAHPASHPAAPARPIQTHAAPAPAPHPMPQPVSHRPAPPAPHSNFVQPAHFPQPQRAPAASRPAPRPAAAAAHPAPQHKNNDNRPGH
jgi:hypothetical protein